jgi:ribonuclease R
MAERRADDATRDVTNWLKCEYLQQHLGETFEGLITAVTAFGFFVELADLYVEGLVHVATLEGDFYQFDKQKQRLTGERSGKRFGLGDSVVVQVAAINLEDRKIDLILMSQGRSIKARKGRSSSNESNGKSKGRSGRQNKGSSEGAGVYGASKSGSGSRKSSGKKGKQGSERGSDKARGKAKPSHKSEQSRSKGKNKTKSEPLRVGKDLKAPGLPAKQEVPLHDSAAPRRRAKLHPVRRTKKDSEESQE